MKKNKRIYIGAGGNIGDSPRIIQEAFEFLSEHLDEAVMSSLYKTAPQEDVSQDFFINSVISGFSELSPLDFLEILLTTEKHFGRKRDPVRPKGPRTLDLDLLLYGDSIVRHNRLFVPHPAIKERAFVLVPLLELSPDLCCPETGISYAKYLPAVENQGISCYNEYQKYGK